MRSIKNETHTHYVSFTFYHFILCEQRGIAQQYLILIIWTSFMANKAKNKKYEIMQ